MDEFQKFRREPSRRDVMKLATCSLLGLSLPQALAMAASNATGKGKAKRVLVLLEQGGLSHMDTWDPKPDAPIDHRSPYKPIDTSVPGIQFTELLAKTAKIAHKLAVVRSMHHSKAGADAHPNGTQYALSGVHPGSPIEMPDIGSVVAQLAGSERRDLPPYIMVPGNHEQAGETRTGYLPASVKVFKTGGKDLSDPTWKVQHLAPREENDAVRLDGRRRLLGAIDSRFAAGAGAPAGLGGMDRFYEQAFDVLTSPKVLEAFDIRAEPEAERAKYGPGHRGSCYLLGRKLIEAGVRFVTVDTRWPLTKDTPKGGNLNWDHHDHIYAKETCQLPGATGAGAGRYGIGHWVMMGSVDHAFAALITDLDERGLLDETLVCFVSEFGRTPKVNTAKGRDHWTNAYSIVFAGAGVPGGQIIGASDSEGGYVKDNPYTPEDYATTIYEKLGLDRDKALYTSTNRPIFFGHMGEPMKQMF